MKQSIFILGILLSLNFSCKDDNDVDGSDRVLNIIVNENGLVVQNKSDRNLYYLLADQDALAAITWMPSVDGEPPLPARSTTTISYEEILGYSSESEVVVTYYWNAVTVDGGSIPGDIEFLELSLE